MQPEDWFTLEELTSRLGALAWVEQRLDELLSEWSTIEVHAPAAILFATAAGHHRWHADVIANCLPTSPQLHEAGVVVAPTAGWSDAVPTLRSLDAPDATVTRLRAVVKIIDPWLVRETTALRDLSRPISDAPLLRWLRFVSLDHDDDGDTAAQLLAARASDAVRIEDRAILNTIDLTST